MVMMELQELQGKRYYYIFRCYIIFRLSILSKVLWLTPLVRSLPSNHNVPGLIPGSAEI